MSQKERNLRSRLGSTLGWNLIDKVATQLLYGLTGIILARVLSQEDFGLVGAILVFQSFATLFIDSGFSYALIQRKRPTHRDYSTIFWFNLLVATGVYLLLYFGAPAIASLFQGDERLVPLSRVMFLSFILNAAAIVQTNRRVKRMDVKVITISNSVSLIAGSVCGIYLALEGFGPWALVWQAIINSAVKTIILWASDSWRPSLTLSFKVLRSFFSVGSGVLCTSLLNVLFQNIYSFFIGHRAGLVPLGYYTQADKWSKMPVASLSAIFTQSFLPLLAEYQDSPERFAALAGRINRFASYVTLPLFTLGCLVATPVFHLLFGPKWDASIILFQLLMARGVFTILTTLYHNYVLSLGLSRLMVWSEILRDGTALIAIFVTLPYIALSPSHNLTLGLTIFVASQLLASIIAWAAMAVIAARACGARVRNFLADTAIFTLPCAAMLLAPLALSLFPAELPPLALTIIITLLSCAIYLIICHTLRLPQQQQLITYIRRRIP